MEQKQYLLIKKALDIATLMIDPENQPPQFTQQEVLREITTAKQVLEHIKSNVNQ